MKRDRPREGGPDDVGQDAEPIITWQQVHFELFGVSVEDCRGPAHVRDAMSRYRAAVMAEALASKPDSSSGFERGAA
jgi:hypothetical protein